MSASRFISDKLKFGKDMTTAAVAISFFIIIIATAVSSGFRKEIRDGISQAAGDITLGSMHKSLYSDDTPIPCNQPWLEDIKAVEGVESVTPVVLRAGIIKVGDAIQGAIFRGMGEGESLGATIPKNLADMLDLKVGDPILCYFVSEKVKARKFKIIDICENGIDTGESMTVQVPISDLRHINSWTEDQASEISIILEDKWRTRNLTSFKNSEIGGILATNSSSTQERLVARSVYDRYPAVFGWLDLIDGNVLAILVLMIIVAGFNMISGLLIVLFRSISTIGTLKALGMSNKGIAEVFRKVASKALLWGMLVGNVAALAICAIQQWTHVLKLNPENYFIGFVPVHINLGMILLSDAIAFLVILALLRIPTHFISRLDPAKTTRVA